MKETNAVRTLARAQKRAGTITLLSALAAMASGGTALAEPFNNVASAAGVEFYQMSEEFNGAPIGAGVAWADFDNDGDDDLYAAQNCGTNGDIPANQCSPTVGCNKLYRNNGDGSFTEIVNAAGAELCGEHSRGVAVADYDNDGDQDIFVTQNGQNKLLRNRLIETGTATFWDATAAAGLDGDGARNSSTATWGDFNEDGYLDLFVGNHRDFVLSPPGTDPVCHEDDLWMSNGDGTFTNIADETGIGLSGELNEVGCTLTTTWSDYDNDGDVDLMVILDFRMSNRLFRNDGPSGTTVWTFDDQSAESEFDYEQAGMGIAVGDLDRDGLFDYYMSDVGKNELAINDGDGTFTESATPANLEADDAEIYGSFGLVGWGNGFFDLDLDGWEDLIVTNGGAPRDIWASGMFGAGYIDNNPVYAYRNNKNSTFTELHTPLGFLSEGYYRTAAMADYDDDGDIDIYVGNLQGLNALYRNDLVIPNNEWLKVKLQGSIGNRDAMGARVEIDIAGETQMREVSGGSSFLSRHSLTQHFGLGENDTVDHMTVTFLGGIQTELIDVAANQTVSVVEPVTTSTWVDNEVSVVAGDPAALSLDSVNHTDNFQATQLWVELFPVAGSQRTLFGPVSLNLPPGASENRNLNLQTFAAMPPGIYRVAVRQGTHPGDITHQDIVFIDVQAAP